MLPPKAIENLKSLTPEQLERRLWVLNDIVEKADSKDLPYLDWVDQAREEIYKILNKR